MECLRTYLGDLIVSLKSYLFSNKSMQSSDWLIKLTHNRQALKPVSLSRGNL